MKVLSFYLPQYHRIKENDEWWEPGFTEWTNVAKARKLFPGHYQPKIPGELGFYNLLEKEILRRQSSLMKEAGIDGQCFWHYWFGNGKVLLEGPSQLLLKSKEVPMNICFGWANHSWYRKTWDPHKKDKLLIEQKYPGKDDIKNHYNYVREWFLDNRYIKINNKPVFLVWDPLGLQEAKYFIQEWNKYAYSDGFDGIHFIGFTFQAEKVQNILNYGFNEVVYDAIKEALNSRNLLKKIINKVAGKIFNIPRLLTYEEYSKFVKKVFINSTLLPCIIPNFDHTPRSMSRGVVLTKSEPKKYEELLRSIFMITSRNSKLLFIKSWNEWGEGNYLEPDLKYGKDWITSTAKALNKND